MAKQTVKRRRRRRVVVVREKNMQNSQDRHNTNLLQSSIYKQKAHKRHLKRIHAPKQQCGQFFFIHDLVIFENAKKHK